MGGEKRRNNVFSRNKNFIIEPKNKLVPININDIVEIKDDEARDSNLKENKLNRVPISETKSNSPDICLKNTGIILK